MTPVMPGADLSFQKDPFVPLLVDGVDIAT
jgi:hypothetical protein